MKLIFLHSMCCECFKYIQLRTIDIIEFDTQTMILYLLHVAISVRLVNLSPEVITAVLNCPQKTSLEINPQAFKDVKCHLPVNVTWTSATDNGTVEITKDSPLATMLNSVPKIAVQGGLVINGKVHARVCQGSTINLGDKMFRITSAYVSLADLYRGDAELQFQYSYDNGKTFTKLAEDNSTRVIIPGIQDDKNSFASGIVSLLKLKNGELLMGFQSNVNATKFCNYVITKSKDEGKTWESPKIITNNSELFLDPSNDRIIQLSSGRIIVPMNTETCVGCHGLCFVIYSDDDGETWSFSDIIDNAGNTCEQPAVQPYDDNTLLMLQRAQGGLALYSVSPDQGKTWSKSKPTNLKTSFVTVNLKKFNGQLYALYNNGPVRQNLTIAKLVSAQDFGVFQNVLQFTGPATQKLYSSNQYSTGIFTPDGKKLFLNYWGQQSAARSDDSYQLVDADVLSGL